MVLFGYILIIFFPVRYEFVDILSRWSSLARVLEVLESTCPAEFFFLFFVCIDLCVPGDFLNSGVCVVMVEWVVSMGLPSSARWVALTWSDG